MGGRGSSGADYAGVTIKLPGSKRSSTYYLRNGKLQNSETLKFMPGDGKETIKKMIQSGGIPLSKKQVIEREKERAEYYKNKPDYELGNPFRKRGLGKTVYRPKRRKDK